MFFVAGVTGNVGGAAARRLLEEGRAVRALVRDPQKASAWAEQGVDIRQGDFTDPAAVASALEGVEGAYLMMPPVFIPSPGYPEAKAVIASFEEALRRSPPPRLVLLSSVGSEQKSGLGNITSTSLMEDALGDLPFPTAFVRAGSFFENYVGGLGGADATGVFYSFLQPVDRAFPMVASADIGAEVARLLMTGWDGKKIVEIGSPVTPTELAGAVGEALGKPVTAQAIPRERWAATLEGFGMPHGMTGAFEEMEDGFNSGWIAFGVPGTEPVPGTTTPVQFFAEVKRGQNGG